MVERVLPALSSPCPGSQHGFAGLLCGHTGPGSLSLWKRPGLSLTHGVFSPLGHALVGNTHCMAGDS